jgi:hypothetical protein
MPSVISSEEDFEDKVDGSSLDQMLGPGDVGLREPSELGLVEFPKSEPGSLGVAEVVPLTGKSGATPIRARCFPG